MSLSGRSGWRVSLSTLFLSIFLVACGGGGGSSGGFIQDGTGDGTGSATDPIITMTLNDLSGEPTTTVTPLSPATLEITVTDAGGTRLPSEVVNVSTDVGVLDFGGAGDGTGSLLTNGNGVARVRILAGTLVGAGTVTASVTVGGGTGTATLNFQVTDAGLSFGNISVALQNSSGQPIDTVTDQEAGVLVITVTDTSGAGIEGQVVSATTTIGVLEPASGTALTDENGQARLGLVSDGNLGAGSVTVSVDGQTGDTFTSSLNLQVIDSISGLAELALQLVDTEGNDTVNITSVDPGRLIVTALDVDGNPVANTLVNVTTTVGTLDPVNGVILTDSTGQASILIVAGDDLGAGSASATIETPQGSTIGNSINFQLGQASLDIGRLTDTNVFVPGEIQAGSTTLAAAGSTPLEVAVVDDDGDLVTAAVEVAFTSACASLTPPLAELTASANTVNGIASGTYTVAGCTGTDTVTASLVGAGNTQTASVTLTVEAAAVNSINFSSAEPTTLALRGTGGEGRSETSIVQFVVTDTTGAPVQGVEVTFTLSTTIGGAELTNTTAITNDEGIARAVVQAGNVSTAVRVTATLDVDGVTLSTVSDRLVISTGLPDQDSISLSVANLAPGGGDFDGRETSLTVRLADKFNNPVPDGTVALFETEYGFIEPSCTTAAGSCSVTWTSTEPRFPNFNADLVATLDTITCPDTLGLSRPCVDNLGFINGLRTTVLVTAIGEESFTDQNGNGLWDTGEPHVDLPEAFRDDNENDDFDGNEVCTPATTAAGRECASGLEEEFVDFNNNGIYNDGNGIYNGSLCPENLEALGQCSRELVNVRDDVAIVMSEETSMRIDVFDSSGTPITGSALPDVTTSVTYTVRVSDQYNNLLPTGSSIQVEGGGCTIAFGANFTTLSSNAFGATSHSFFIEEDPTNVDPATGTLVINVTTANGVIYSRGYTCTDTPL